MSKRQPDKAIDLEACKAALDSQDTLTGKQIRAAVEAAQQGVLVARDGRRMSPRSVANLKAGCTLREMPPEQARATRVMGAVASAQAQARRRTIREIYTDLLQQPDTITADDVGELAAAAQGMARRKGVGLTVYDAIAVAMAARAKAGDVRAATFVRDSVGDKPADEITATVDTMTDGDRALVAKLAAQMGVDASLVHDLGEVNSEMPKNDDGAL